MGRTVTSFKPGHKKVGGRKKGGLNKATRDIRDMARALVEDQDYQASLQSRLRAGQASHMETLLHQYAYGKPKETVEVQSGKRPLEIIVEHVRDKLNGHG